jgi:site-specific recombinase XerD
MCFEKAVEENLIRTNPAKGCKLPPKKAKEMQVLTPDEMQRFIIQAKADGYFELFVLELCTGMRRGEILGLQWGDINMHTGELHICRQVVLVDGNIQISTPKTKSSIRTIIIPPDIVKILAEYKKRINSIWIFPSPKSKDTPLHPASVTSILDRLLKRAECKDIRFHDLRHTFATNALASGMDIKTLSTIIGHISAETTLNIYTHITDNMQRSAANKIERGFGRKEGRLCKDSKTPDQTVKTPQKAKFEPKQPKIRRPGMGCVYRISDNLWEGSYSPRLPDGKRKKFNVYAKTREECEKLLAEMIEEKKAKIKKEKELLK